MQVFVTQGEHFNVPGAPLTVHMTQASARAEAASLVNIMLNDTGEVEGKPSFATAANWHDALEWLQGYHGARDCWVEVSAHNVVEG